MEIFPPRPRKIVFPASRKIIPSPFFIRWESIIKKSATQGSWAGCYIFQVQLWLISDLIVVRGGLFLGHWAGNMYLHAKLLAIAIASREKK